MPKESYNNNKLNDITHNIFSINSVDQTPQVASDETNAFLKGISQSQTGGLSDYLVLKKGARVMVKCNIDMRDRLINGQMRFAFGFVHKSRKITKIYVKLDDAKAGEVARSNDNYGRRNVATPVEMAEAQFSVKVHSHMINCKRDQ